MQISLIVTRVSAVLRSQRISLNRLTVFNFWEPLHFLHHNYGFQTWEVSPQFALRSWSYILLHFLPPRLGAVILPNDKV